MSEVSEGIRRISGYGHLRTRIRDRWAMDLGMDEKGSREGRKSSSPTTSARRVS